MTGDSINSKLGVMGDKKDHMIGRKKPFFLRSQEIY